MVVVVVVVMLVVEERREERDKIKLSLVLCYIAESSTTLNGLRLSGLCTLTE